jgi:sugar diacid utilization regulator
MNNLRLTVHLADVQKKDVQTDKRIKTAQGKFQYETKRKIFNTLSFYVKDKEEANRKLAEVRSMYQIQLGQDPNKKDKYGKELINLSFVK